MRVASKKYEKLILICIHNNRFDNKYKEEIHKRLKSPLNCFQVVEIRVEKEYCVRKGTLYSRAIFESRRIWHPHDPIKYSIGKFFSFSFGISYCCRPQVSYFS